MPRKSCLRCSLGINTCETKRADAELGREVERRFKPGKALADPVARSGVSLMRVFHIQLTWLGFYTSSLLHHQVQVASKGCECGPGSSLHLSPTLKE